jgi:thiamine-phosphate pyrophosphorylase
MVVTGTKPELKQHELRVGYSSTRLHCMQLYAITDRNQTSQPLPSLAEGWSEGGVHFIQLREKDLDPAALRSLVRQVRGKIDHSSTKLLVNVSTPASIALALAAGADGVHLAGQPRPGAAGSVRQTFGDNAIISVPCHSLQDIELAASEKVDLMLFSPVFEKLPGSLTQGLEGLRVACAAAHGIPVFALGGVTIANAPDCEAAGAAGIAAIRLFAGDDWRRLAQAR